MTKSHDEQPPSYDSCVASTSSDPLEEPVLLVLVGQSIRAGSAAGAPLFETNRGVANLGHATTCVELRRVERRVDSSSSSSGGLEAVEDAKEFGGDDGEAATTTTPRVKVRRRHVMDLVHPTGKGGTVTSVGEAMTGTPGYYAKPWTKMTYPGVWGLKKASSLLGMRGGGGWQVLPVKEKAKYGEPRFEDGKGGVEVLFRVVKAAGGGSYEWRTGGEGDGRLLAVEELGEGEGEGDDGNGKEHRLRTTTGMERSLMDVLVAMWCCRIWEESAAAQPPVHEGLDKGE
ncbi:hypothetical protein ISF_04894 [Cordyceps fumosorosea ARSEF 2679]|uniref:Uncharacterized protein n=1 Tax=Cordyceps fumosorosea (strain ARSEF 2679) TaxID=1081104 RepID=A0A167VVA2_CORFA|nr:hypothetical protein ISF_04894 [Cordyceps fumosorosea ARSEF 2679]OAA63018.1 hypothetical protein ISF_04894 [Cordyceps fumosorosea ARSEF 2679]